MSGIPGDLVLLAAMARMYGFHESAQDLYLLAQLGADRKMTMTGADMETGLSLLGLLCARIVADRIEVPQIVTLALGEGHAVAAQYRDRLHPRAAWWCALCDAHAEEWRGLAVRSDFSAHNVGSSLGGLLTGHYLIITRQLPEWPEPSRMRFPLLN